MPGIVNPAFRCNKSCDNLEICINRYRCFEEVFPNLTGSRWIIMTWIPAGKAGWIDRSDCDGIVIDIKQVQSFSERVLEIQGFYSAEEFLESCIMGNNGKVQLLLDRVHVFNIFYKFPVILIPIVFEENQNQQLMLRKNLFRILARIRTHPYWFHNQKRGSDKPDIPARWFINRLLPIWRHIKRRRHCTLDLSVIITFGFR